MTYECFVFLRQETDRDVLASLHKESMIQVKWPLLNLAALGNADGLPPLLDRWPKSDYLSDQVFFLRDRRHSRGVAGVGRAGEIGQLFQRQSWWDLETKLFVPGCHLEAFLNIVLFVYMPFFLLGSEDQLYAILLGFPLLAIEHRALHTVGEPSTGKLPAQPGNQIFSIQNSLEKYPDLEEP